MYDSATNNKEVNFGVGNLYAKFPVIFLCNFIKLAFFFLFFISSFLGGLRGWPMRGLETDHVISGPMRGLKINFTGRGHTYKHTGIANIRLTRPRGPVQ